MSQKVVFRTHSGLFVCSRKELLFESLFFWETDEFVTNPRFLVIIWWKMKYLTPHWKMFNSNDLKWQRIMYKMSKMHKSNYSSFLSSKIIFLFEFWHTRTTVFVQGIWINRISRKNVIVYSTPATNTLNFSIMQLTPYKWSSLVLISRFLLQLFADSSNSVSLHRLTVSSKANQSLRKQVNKRISKK